MAAKVTTAELRATANALQRTIVKPTLPANRVGAVCVEPTVGHWTGNNEWGYRIDTFYPQLEGGLIPILNNPGLPGPPRSLALTLFRSALVAKLAVNAEIRAQLTYGAGGVSNTVLVDWGNGGSICIPCNTMRVDAISYAPFAPPDVYNPTFNNAPVKLTLGAIIGVEGAVPALPPSFTTPFATVAPGATLVAVVPEFARVVVPVINDVGGSPADYRISAGGMNTLVTEGMLRTGLQLPFSFLTTARLTNNSAVNKVMCFKFLLGL